MSAFFEIPSSCHEQPLGWLAIACLADYPLIDKTHPFPQSTDQQISNRFHGSQACRHLLMDLQSYILLDSSKLPSSSNLAGVTSEFSPLITDGYPYYFSYQARRFFVSFSHSRKQIAVLVSSYQKLGVDIEDRQISVPIAQRYFTEGEQEWLAELDGANQQNMAYLARRLLWTLKESQIKASLSADALFAGIASPIDLDTNQLTALCQTTQILQLQSTSQLITYGFLPTYGCGFCIQSC